MSIKQTIDWQGYSGQTYRYWIFQIGTISDEKPGNYIYAKETSQGHWTALYIGQTNNLSERLAEHEKEECSLNNGATHIHAHENDSEEARLSEERDLIEAYNPVCNEQI